MDGFAVRAADVAAAPVTLPVVATLPAGAAPDRAVGPGEAIRIMTGAPIPPGADAVVMVELTESGADGTVTINSAVAEGTAVRPAGDDLPSGEPVVQAGVALTPGHLGLLASAGVTEVLVHRRPRVGVLSTGDELVDKPVPLAPGQIRDSNRGTLLALVAEADAEAVDLGLVGDEESAVEGAVRASVERCDLLLTSGGVSMGDFDPIKVVLRRLAPDMEWAQVAIRPAKPLAFGSIAAVDARSVPVIGLPGNPVSSMVSFELFARPAIRRMLGFADARLGRLAVHAVADDDCLERSPDGKTHFVRVVLDYRGDGFHVRSAGGQGSHQLSAMATANALAVVPDGDGSPAGSRAEVLVLGEVPVA
jgi:molybdenum cofactor synthesis domain-containing protein